MATTLMQNSCISGAMGALLAGHFFGSVTPGDYDATNAKVASAARAISNEFISVNGASGAAMADGDNATMYYLIEAVTYGTIVNSGATSITDADYLAYGRQIYGAVKEALTKFV